LLSVGLLLRSRWGLLAVFKGPNSKRREERGMGEKGRPGEEGKVKRRGERR